MVDWGSTTSAILAGFYGIVALSAILALTGRFHPAQKSLRTFSWLLLLNASCRIVYFGVPPSAWGTGETPGDLERFSTPWWMNLVQLFFFLVPNWAAYAEYVAILVIWHEARSIVNNGSTTFELRVVKALHLAKVALAIFSLGIVVVYFFAKFTTVLLSISAVNTVLSLALSAAFISYWISLFRAMMSVKSRLLAETSQLLTSAEVGGAVPRTNGEGVTSTLLARIVDESQGMIARTNDKLVRISFVCFFCLFCSLTKVGMESFQAYALLSDTSGWRAFWWAVIFGYYTASEVITSLAVLVFTRKKRLASAGVAKTSLASSSGLGSKPVSYSTSGISGGIGLGATAPLLPASPTPRGGAGSAFTSPATPPVSSSGLNGASVPGSGLMTSPSPPGTPTMARSLGDGGSAWRAAGTVNGTNGMPSLYPAFVG